MKSLLKIAISIFVACTIFTSCKDSEETFPEYDSYLYLWGQRVTLVGENEDLSDIDLAYFFKGDTTQVEGIYVWVFDADSTLYVDEAEQHMDRAFKITSEEIKKHSDQKNYKKMCGYRLNNSITKEFYGTPIRVYNDKCDTTFINDTTIVDGKPVITVTSEIDTIIYRRQNYRILMKAYGKTDRIHNSPVSLHVWMGGVYNKDDNKK